MLLLSASVRFTSFFISNVAILMESLPNKQIIFPIQARKANTYRPLLVNILESLRRYDYTSVRWRKVVLIIKVRGEQTK